MASKIKVDQLEGSTGSTITVPTGQTFTVTDGIPVASGGTGIASFTAGDILYATGATTLTKLGKGTAEQVLAMNTGATAPDWGSVDLTVLPTITVAKGGTNLSSFTEGDILYATGATTLAKLAKGSGSQTLKMNSGATAPEWATVAAASADYVKIATVAVTGSAAASINMEGCFTSTYTLYQLRFQRGVASAAAYFYPVMLNESNVAMTDTYYSKGYYLTGEFNSSSGSGVNSLTATTGMKLSNDNNSNRPQLTTNGTMNFYDPLLTLGADPLHTFRTRLFGGALSSNYFWWADWIVYQGTDTPYGGIQFKMSGGDIEVGFTATMYGIKT